MTDQIKHSAEWAIIRRWNNEQVGGWRAEMESLICTPDRTQQLRGMIYAATIQNERFDPQQSKPVIIEDANYG